MKNTLIYIVIGACLFFAGWFSKPDKVKTEIKTVEVVREVRVKDEVTDRVITEHPDGTRVIKERVETRTETNIDKNKNSLTKIEAVKPQWSVGGYISVIGQNNTYLLTVDRRIIGNIFIGLYGRTDLVSQNEAGLGLRIEF